MELFFRPDSNVDIQSVLIMLGQNDFVALIHVALTQCSSLSARCVNNDKVWIAMATALASR